MKCSACNKEIKNENSMILISCDGDFVCDKKCKTEYTQKRKEFYKTVINNPRKFEKWLFSEEE